EIVQKTDSRGTIRPPSRSSLVCAPQYRNCGTLLRVRKGEPSVTNLCLARLNSKRPDLVCAPVVGNETPVCRNLQQQRLSTDVSPGAVGYLIDEEYVPGFVDGHFAVDKAREGNRHRSATSTLHDHIDQVLRESVERNAPRIQAAILAL